MFTYLWRSVLDHAPAPVRHGFATMSLLTGTTEVTGYSLGMLAANITVQILSTTFTVVWVLTLLKAARYDQAVWDRSGHSKAMWIFIIVFMPLYGVVRFWWGGLGWIGGAQDSLHFDLMRARVDLLTGYTIAMEQGIPDPSDPALYALTPYRRAQVNQDLGLPARAGPLSPPPAQHAIPAAGHDWQRTVYRPPVSSTSTNQERP